MTATFFNRVRVCVSLIEQYGLKNVIIATREARIHQKTGTANVSPTPAFRRFQVFQ